ncbi:MAG: 8-oxo-dGTP diphosphatase [Clostridia bacterium]|nr:8-oxo-dGTP diphosphatase [Clostridia bacterium]
MAEQAVFMNMCMVCNGSKILVQHRTKKDWSGVAFPGGHVEAGESFTDAVVREVREETGLSVGDLTLCGVKQWNRDGVRNVVFLYRADSFSGELRSSEEGTVYWVERDALQKEPLAEGFWEDFQGFVRQEITEVFLCQQGNNWNREYK